MVARREKVNTLTHSLTSEQSRFKNIKSLAVATISQKIMRLSRPRPPLRQLAMKSIESKGC